MCVPTHSWMPLLIMLSGTVTSEITPRSTNIPVHRGTGAVP